MIFNSNTLILPSLISIIISVAIAIGSYSAYKRSRTKGLEEIQSKAVETYASLNTALEGDIKRLKNDVIRLQEENNVMRAAFKKLGFDIELDNGTITLFDEQQKVRKRIMQVHINDKVAGDEASA